MAQKINLFTEIIIRAELVKVLKDLYCRICENTATVTVATQKNQSLIVK